MESTALRQLHHTVIPLCSLEFNLLQNFYLAVIELYRGRRAVPLQTFTTRHCNRKLSIVMAF